MYASALCRKFVVVQSLVAAGMPDNQDINRYGRLSCPDYEHTAQNVLRSTMPQGRVWFVGTSSAFPAASFTRHAEKPHP